MFYHTKFGHSRTNHLGVDMDPKNVRRDDGAPSSSDVARWLTLV